MASKPAVVLPSNRKFGLLFLAVLGVIGVLGIRKGWPTEWIVACFSASAIFGILGILDSTFLTPINKAWLHLGLLMGKVVNPIVMGVIFFVIIAPVAILARLLGLTWPA